MKVKRIKVENFKAISNQEMDFDGCSALIVGGNNRGKTSFLNGLISRFRKEKPEIIVREGEEEGFNILELTDGSVIKWDFTEKGEKFSFLTTEGFTQTKGVLSSLGEKYFGKKFDIDKFLIKSPKQQQKELQDVLGLNLDDIEARYKEAYSQRTDANRELKRLEAINLEEPQKIEKPKTDVVKQELKRARSFNETASLLNKEKKEASDKLENVLELLDKEGLFKEFFDSKMAQRKVDLMEEKELIDTEEIERRLESENEKLRKFDAYERDLSDYKKWLKDRAEASSTYISLNERVKSIEEEKKEAIEGADMPEGFDIDDSGLTYKGFALSENQISQSAKYIAALKLGEKVLGEVRTLHFDASSLDNNSLKEVQDFANKKDLQLLIERPDFEGGEIEYRIIH